jgi:hypothetical protein
MMCRKNVLTIVAMAILALAIGQVQVAMGTLGDLSAAMSDLMDHIDGTTPLTGPQIETRTATIEANKAYMDDNTTIMGEAFTLVDYYDTIVGPLWINAETNGGFPRVQGGSDGYELERALFTVQQAIIDVIYTSANCQTYQTFLNGKILETSDFFPGACTPPVDPEVSYNVAINASNPTMWGRPVCYGPIPARRPTGVYLAPGSIGEVTVPSAIVNQGFKIQVGAHAVDKYVYYKDDLRRLDRVTTSFNITSTVTIIANPLGGGVYIIVPYQANFGTQTVSIANVVQSPLFSATTLHQTTLQEWTQTERLHPGPWADFESDVFMMNIPTSWIYAYADPISQIDDWDLAMDAVSELIGYGSPHNVRNIATLYLQTDRSIQHGAYGTGYPQINDEYNPDNPTNGNSSHSWLTNVLGSPVEYHELSHCQLFSKFPGHEESTVNLPYVYVAHVKFGVPLVDAFTNSMQLGYLENIDVDQAALTWFVTVNFRSGNPMNLTDTEMNEVRYQHRGYGRCVEIGELFGWDKLINFYYQEQLDYISPPPSDGLTTIDSRIFRLSKAVGYDMTPLIHCWGVHPEEPGNLQQAMIDEGIPKSSAFGARLLHYKDIIPADNAEFWVHYTTIYPSQPEGGNPNYQYGWYNVWKYIYDTEEGTAAKAAMQYIIDLYYDPDVTAPTPNPMTWASVPAAAGDSSITMTASVATDNLHGVEYYFACTAGAGHNSAWQTSNTYVDTGLQAQTQYTYKAKARDTSNNHNNTGYSTAKSATTDADTGAPTPNPATFATVPTAVSDTEIVMASTIGVDGSTPVAYFFDETSGNPGATDSGWVTNPVYYDTGLSPDTQYTYTVQMRDALLNTGTASTPASTMTPLAGSITVTVPNSGFETIYKPNSTTITATITGWTQGVGPDCPIDAGVYTFSDQTTGTLGDIPGWLGYDRDGWIAWGGTYGRDQATGNLQGSVSTGNNHTPSGAYCYLVNGAGWGNPAGGLITSEASLGTIQYNATYVLSMYANGSATPVVLNLLANGAVVTPTSSVDPVLSGTYQQFIRMYDVNDLTSYTGQAIKIVCGLGRDAESTQSHFDDVSLKYYEYASEDTTPPTPNPATFSSAPAAVSSTQITMTATTGTDETGPVEYYFDETTGHSGGSDSGWVTNPVYNDTGLSASTQYTYTVQMRDALLNTGTASSPASATTPAVQFVAAGAVKSGTGAISPALPSGIAANDILLLFIETANQAVSISNQNGGTWAAVTSSPQGTGTAGGTAATRLTVFWSRYNGTQGAPTVSDSGNHQLARMVAIRGAVSSGNPWDVTAGGVDATSDTSASIPGATTTVANTLVVVATAGSLPDASGTAQFSAWTNANLTSLTERTDNSVSSGNGGSLGIATGFKATAGAYGNTAVTHANSAVKGMISIAIRP